MTRRRLPIGIQTFRKMRGVSIHLIAVELSQETRNFVGFETTRA